MSATSARRTSPWSKREKRKRDENVARRPDVINFLIAKGQLADGDRLVAIAEIIAHAVVGLDPATLAPGTVLSGERFGQAGITGVVEEDFFDWIIEIEGGESFVRTLARRLMRFDWGDVEHDVMKVLYESVISAEQRHRLGEYYTPDWLAERMVAEIVDAPFEQRTLDPACGSGTFLFHALRRYLAAAEESNVPTNEAIVGATRHVLGIDVIARVPVWCPEALLTSPSTPSAPRGSS